MKYLFAVALAAGSIIGVACASAQALPQIPDLQQGSAGGLNGGDLNTYTSECAN